MISLLGVHWRWEGVHICKRIEEQSSVTSEEEITKTWEESGKDTTKQNPKDHNMHRKVSQNIFVTDVEMQIILPKILNGKPYVRETTSY